MTLNWNYRVFLEENGDYILREVFYDAVGKIVGCTAETVEPFFQLLAGLAQELAAMQPALSLPVLTLAERPTEQPVRQRPKGQNRVAAEVWAALGWPAAVRCQPL